jgi:outer membrane usher protein
MNVPPHLKGLSSRRGAICARGSALAVVLLTMGGALADEGHAAEPEPAVFRVTVNEVNRGVFTVVLTGGDVLVRPADLVRIGIPGTAGTRVTVEQETYVSLASLAPAVTFSVDEETLVLHLRVSSGERGRTIKDLLPGPPAELVYSQDTTAFLNTALTGIDFERFRWAAEAGLSVKNMLLLSTAARDERGTLSRGLSSFTVDDRSHLLRWLAGDRFDTTGPLGAQVQLGGVSVSREFSLDPYFVRFPTVGLSGAALSPSIAEVYVNGQLVRREEIPAGPFELRNLPVGVGSGTAQVILRDAFGRAQEITSPFYFTPTGLKAGVQEFSYDLGFERDLAEPGLGQYRQLTLLARHRIGVTDDVTPGFRLEATPRLASGGPIVILRLPIGALEISGAGSHEQGLTGWAASLAYSYARGPISVGLAAQALSDHYANVSLRAGADRPTLDVTALLGFALTSRATMTAQYSHADFRDLGPRERVSATLSLRLTNLASLFVTASRSAQRRVPTGYDVFGGLVYFLGERTTATVSHAYNRQENGASQIRTALEVQRSLPLGPGFGYRAQVNRTEQHTPATPGGAGSSATEDYGGLALLQYQGGYGFYETSYQRSGSRDATILTAAAGLAAMGGGLHVGRPLQDAFALVRVPEVPGIRGYLNNQDMGRTSSNGDLLLPNLLPYFGNNVGIAGTDLPFEYSLGPAERVVAPPFRGGAVVTFPVSRVQGFIGRVVIERGGQPLVPAYGQLTLAADVGTYESPIGEDGEIYLENVPAGRYQATIEYKRSTCRTTVQVPVSTATLVELGPIRCTTP